MLIKLTTNTKPTTILLTYFIYQYHIIELEVQVEKKIRYYSATMDGQKAIDVEIASHLMYVETCIYGDD
mgnify:CR=1 FL=1